LNWFPFTRWEDDAIGAKPWAFVTAGGEASGVRVFGVLQRIALCYFFAAVIAHYLKQKGAFVLAAFLLFFYWQLCIFAHPADPFSLAHWFGTKIDLAIVGEAHIYRGEGVPFDPEGIDEPASGHCTGDLWLVGRKLYSIRKAGQLKC
jgi:predicted acyltransferase